MRSEIVIYASAAHSDHAGKPGTLFPEAFVPDGSRFLHSCPGRDSRLVAHLPPPRIRSHRVLRRARRRLRQRLPQELPQRHVPRSSHPGPCDPRGPRDPASHRLPRSRRSHSLSNWRYLHKPGPSTSDPPSCTSPSPCSRLHPPTASRRVDPGRSLRRILQLRAAAAKRPVLLRQPVGRAAAGASGLALFRNRDFPATSWRVCRNWKARGSHACRNGTSTPPSRSRPPSCRDEVVALMATHPKADFLLPESFRASIPAHSKRSRRRISARSGAAVYPCLSVFIRVELP